MKRTAIVLLLGMILVFSACCKTDPEAVDLQIGEGILSSFITKDLDGNIVDQEILKGKKLTLVNVWATFCGPCLKEMPELEKLSMEMADRRFQVIGIVADLTDLNYQVKGDELREAKEIVAQTGVSFPSLIPCRDLAAVCFVQSVPTTFFVDENGRQIGRAYVGARDLTEWRRLVESILEGLSK